MLFCITAFKEQKSYVCVDQHSMYVQLWSYISFQLSYLQLDGKGSRPLMRLQWKIIRNLLLSIEVRTWIQIIIPYACKTTSLTIY